MRLTNAVIALAGSVLLWSCQVNPRFSKLSIKEQKELTPPSFPGVAVQQEALLAGTLETKSTTETQVYKIDAAAIQQLVTQKEIAHVYVYGSFCKPCVAELPAIMHLHEANPSVGLVMVTPESWVELNQIK